MNKIIITFILMLGFGVYCNGHYLVPLYAPGNSGGVSSNTDNIGLSVTGQNVIGEMSDANNKVFLGLLAPLSFTSTNVEINKSGIIKLGQNYPNPYKNKTIIPFEISKETKVNLSIYNVIGQPVEIVVDRKFPMGKHEIEYDSRNIKPGIYFYQLRVEKYQLTKSMVLTK